MVFRNNTTLPLLKTNVEGDTVHRYSGWPMFDSAGKYLGPLPSPRRSQTSLVRSERDESFRTGSTATYPAELCKLLAELILRVRRATSARGEIQHYKVVHCGGNKFAKFAWVLLSWGNPKFTITINSTKHFCMFLMCTTSPSWKPGDMQGEAG